MDIKTFRARSLRNALQLVQQELGPDARVICTQSRRQGLLGRLLGNQLVEVTATGVRSNATAAAGEPHMPPQPEPVETASAAPKVAPVELNHRDRFRQFAVAEQSSSLLESMIEQHQHHQQRALPTILFRAFTELLDAGVDSGFARSAVAEIEQQLTPADQTSVEAVKERLLALFTAKVSTTPPIGTRPDRRQVVALIGPTGVGKTTTIAKLAANLRLRDKRRVGLITVDTYRIAAVDQLRAYADIIDLPMEVVTTPREMRDAVTKLSNQDIVLIDTAGRSPHDEIQIQELKAMLGEARADETHLVLSSVCHGTHLRRTVEHFRPAGPTSLLLTKLDETNCRGHLLPLLCESQVPISYTTHGQNVPDDIQAADAFRLLEPIFKTHT